MLIECMRQDADVPWSLLPVLSTAQLQPWSIKQHKFSLVGGLLDLFPRRNHLPIFNLFNNHPDLAWGLWNCKRRRRKMLFLHTSQHIDCTMLYYVMIMALSMSLLFWNVTGVFFPMLHNASSVPFVWRERWGHKSCFKINKSILRHLRMLGEAIIWLKLRSINRLHLGVYMSPPPQFNHNTA